MPTAAMLVKSKPNVAMLAGLDSPLASLHILLALARLRVAQLPKFLVAFIP